MPPQVVTVRNAGKVAAALANEKCQRILDYLGRHEDATETQLSKALDIPLSTVHYNMKILSDAQLVLNNEYTYSPKGKEVTHYKVNKNPIVIVQEESSSLELLKAITPAAIIAGGIGIAYSLYQKMHFAAQTAAPEFSTMMAEDASAKMAGEAGATAAMRTIEAAPAMVVQSPPDMMPWFVAGVVTTLLLSFITLAGYNWWRKRIPE
jgi:DNA-binding transcriptional ArsR family regulator